MFRVENLSLTGKKPLRQIHLAIDRGILAVVGTDRDGVREFIRSVSGVERRAKGKIRYQGAPLDACRAVTATVLADSTLPDHLTVFEVLRAAASARGDRKGIDLAHFGLGSLAPRLTHTLLPHEAKAVLIVEALGSTVTKLVFLEDPFAYVDPRLGAALAKTMRSASDKAIVMTCSSMTDAKIAEQVVRLQHGQLVPVVSSAGAEPVEIRVVGGGALALARLLEEADLVTKLAVAAGVLTFQTRNQTDVARVFSSASADIEISSITCRTLVEPVGESIRPPGVRA